VEIHAANGFLVNQFWLFLDTDPHAATEAISDGSSSLVNSGCRRFAADVVAAVVDEIGAHRVGVRLSPFTACTCTDDDDPEGHALHLVQSMDKLGVLYCHMVEPRTTRADDGGEDDDGKLTTWRRLLPFREAFRGTFMVNGGYGREEGDRVVGGGYADLVSYGRLFLANPDLPERFRKKAGLNKYDRSAFYTSHPVLGYTDYPFLGQETPVAQ
jgi:12-oxophytodienoic acid reductase